MAGAGEVCFLGSYRGMWREGAFSGLILGTGSVRVLGSAEQIRTKQISKLRISRPDVKYWYYMGFRETREYIRQRQLLLEVC